MIFRSDMSIFSSMMQAMVDKPLNYTREVEPSIVPIYYLEAMKKLPAIKTNELVHATGKGVTIVREVLRKCIAYNILTKAPGSVRGKETTYLLTQYGKNYIKEQLDGHNKTCDD